VRRYCFKLIVYISRFIALKFLRHSCIWLKSMLSKSFPWFGLVFNFEVNLSRLLTFKWHAQKVSQPKECFNFFLLWSSLFFFFFFWSRLCVGLLGICHSHVARFPSEPGQELCKKLTLQLWIMKHGKWCHQQKQERFRCRRHSSSIKRYIETKPDNWG